ncbi:hypothetical protein PsYK624_088930 [Phanerochaete sordida]|uniref:Uncharacterized protein n=1 Tax=Phanerochaete sordida TaxID=48140 RepID=A0A9P3GBJ0_9APHY|nr:hypothetical protein PsYK624_088930 [Phanerochaete sordida]
MRACSSDGHVMPSSMVIAPPSPSSTALPAVLPSSSLRICLDILTPGAFSELPIFLAGERCWMVTASPARTRVQERGLSCFHAPRTAPSMEMFCATKILSPSGSSV